MFRDLDSRIRIKWVQNLDSPLTGYLALRNSLILRKNLNFMCHLVGSLYTSYVVPLTTWSRRYDSFGQVRKRRLRGDYERLRAFNWWVQMQTQDFDFKDSFLLIIAPSLYHWNLIFGSPATPRTVPSTRWRHSSQHWWGSSSSLVRRNLTLYPALWALASLSQVYFHNTN